eukprot:TRINITY_DN2565_c0_g1_i1.p1 TRINITY_DN2565_c0_g1~~TRINITY_DN2565_c0_g1_i1.p1  ORF type:complete len:1758 (-),score=465.77 TRINITY_DN2565_c0_g1_i1:1914-7187(-)
MNPSDHEEDPESEEDRRLKEEEQRWEEEKRRRNIRRRQSESDLIALVPSEDQEESQDSFLQSSQSSINSSTRGESKDQLDVDSPIANASSDEGNITGESDEEYYETKDEPFEVPSASVDSSDSEESVAGEEDVEQLRERLQKEKQKWKETQVKMLTLVNNVDTYKHFIEVEKQSTENKLELTELEYRTKIRELADECEELRSENTQLKQHFIAVVEEYDQKILQMEEEKKVRNKENIENLQTLIKELTYIEEINQTMNTELAAEKEAHQSVRDQLELSKRITAELEGKLERQHAEFQQKLSASDGPTKEAPVLNSDVSKELEAERAKMNQVVQLVRQLVGVTSAADISGAVDVTTTNKLQDELRAHDGTKKQLDEAEKQSKELKRTIVKLELRVKQLIQSHSATLQSIESAPQNKQGSLRNNSNLKRSEENLREVAPPAPSIHKRISATIPSKDVQKALPAPKPEDIFSFVVSGDTANITKLLKKNKSLINAADSHGKSPLHKAVIAGRVPIVKLLLDYHPDINMPDSNGWTALHYATVSPVNNTEMLRLLLKQPNIKVDAVNNDKTLPLHYYVRSKFLDQEVLLNLINMASDKNSINTQNRIGETVLHKCCMEEGQEVAAKIIIREGKANVNLLSLRGDTPLHYAVRMNLPAVVILLLEEGADTTAVGSSGTALESANSEEVKNILINAKEYQDRKKGSKRTMSKMGRMFSNSFSMSTDMTGQISPTKSDSESSRRNTVTNDPSLLVNVTLPERGFAIKVVLKLKWSNEKATEKVRRKIPATVGNVDNFSLFFNGVRLEGNEKIGHNTKLAETKELIFRKDPEPRPKKERSSPAHHTKRNKSSSAFPTLSKNTSLVTTVNPLLGDSSNSQKSHLSKSVNSLRRSHENKPLSVSPKKAVLMQSVIRRYLAKKRYKQLVSVFKDRKNVSFMLLKTELAFFQTLYQFSTLCIKPIQFQASKQMKDTTKDLFYAFDALMTITNKVVTQLRLANENWQPNLRLANIYYDAIPSSLGTLGQHYIDYARQYYESIQALKNKEFVSTLAKIANMNDSLIIHQSLFEPVRHCADLKKQLETFLKFTPADHKDIQDLTVIINQLDEAGEEIKSLQATADNQDKIAQIQAAFINPSSIDHLKLQQRFFIREGSMLVAQPSNISKRKKRWLYLFHDLLLVCKKVSSKAQSLQTRESVLLTPDMEVSEYTNPKLSKDEQALLLASKRDKSYSWVLFASGAQEKSSWIRILKSVLEDLKEELSNGLGGGISRTRSNRDLSKTKRDSFVKGRSVSKNFSKEMLTVLTQSACAICHEKFKVTRKKYNCKECGNAVCSNCSSKISAGGVSAGSVSMSPATPPRNQSEERICDMCKLDKLKGLTIVDLPDTIMIRIAALLSLELLPSFFATCKRWGRFSKEEDMWRVFYSRTWMAPNAEWVAKNGWKAACILETNWTRGKAKQSLLKGHSGAIACLQFSGNVLISGSMDQSARIWDIEKMECLHVLKGHNGTVKGVELIMSKGWAVTTADSSVKFWNLQNGLLVNTVKVHASEITCLQYDLTSEFLISGSSDKTIKFMNVSTQKVTATFTGFKSAISCLYASKGRLLVATQNEVSLWDIKEQRALINNLKNAFPTTSPPTNSPSADIARSIHMAERYLATGSDDGSIALYSDGLKDVLAGAHSGKVHAVQFDRNKIISGSSDATIKVWPINYFTTTAPPKLLGTALDAKISKQCLATLKPEAGWVRCLQFDQAGMLVSGHGDNTIRVWDFFPKK